MVSIEPTRFRNVMGNYPTGVVAVTALDNEGRPAGMTVGTFSSVSLDPPLVSFMPDKNSSTFPLIREAGKFCVNFLTAEQEPVCRALARKGGEKFKGVSWSPSPVTESPIIEGSLGWIDCEISEVYEAGDHYIVLGAVKDLDIMNSSLPLVFFQGGFGRFSSFNLASQEAAGPLLRELKHVEAARPHVEELGDLGVECLAMVRQGTEMLTLASWSGDRSHSMPSRLGQRQPIIPPMGALLVAWEGPEVQNQWLSYAGDDPVKRQYLEGILARVRDRGWSIGFDSEPQRRFAETVSAIAPEGATPQQQRTLDEIASLINTEDTDPDSLQEDQSYAIRSISAPVFDHTGHVTMMLALFGFRTMRVEEIVEQRTRLVDVATAVTNSIDGRVPNHLVNK